MKKNKKIPIKTSPIHSQNNKHFKYQNSSTQSRDEVLKTNQSREKLINKEQSSIIKIIRNHQNSKNKPHLQQNTLKTISNIRQTPSNKQNILLNQFEIQKNKIYPNTVLKQNTCALLSRNHQFNHENLKDTVPQIQLSLVDSFDERQIPVDYNTIRQKDKSAKPIQKMKYKKNRMLFTTECNESEKNYTRTSLDNKDQIVLNKYSTSGTNFNKILKCKNHPNKDAKYFVQLTNDEDLLCCQQCGFELSEQRYQLQQIESLRCKRTYDMDEFLQKSLKSMNIVRKCLQYLPEHYKNLFSELKLELQTHDNYYNSIIELVTKKKEQTKIILTNSLNNISSYFSNLHNDLEKQLDEIQSCYNGIIVNREDLKKISEKDFNRIIQQSMKKIIIEEDKLNTKFELWKVEVGDIKEFEKQFQKFLVRIQEDEKKEKQILAESKCQLYCEQQFEEGIKRPSISVTKDKQIYFSFQKKDKSDLLFAYQNQFLNSPEFKQP